MGAYLALAMKQLTANRGLAAVMGLGIVVAATLLAAAPIYSRAMADLGLTYTIRNDLKDNANSRVEFAGVPLKSAEGVELRGAIERRIDERIGWFRTTQTRAIRLGRFTLGRPGVEAKGAQPLGEPQSIQEYEGHVRLVAGTLPAATDGSVIEVAMSPRAAQIAGLKPGDTFEFREQFDNCERELNFDAFPPPPPPCPIVSSAAFAFPAKLTGLIEPTDPAEGYWLGTAARYFDAYTLPIEGVGPILPMLANEATLLEGFGSRYPSYRAYTQWQVGADAEKLTRTNFRRAREDLVALYAEFEPLGGFAVSPLRDTLLRFGNQADYQQTPLTVLLLEITGIALFYVGLVAAIVIERQGGEIALLRGRGASIWQILLLYVTQGLAIGLPTLLIAPFLAAGATALLGLTPIFDRVTEGELLPVTVVPLSFAFAAGGVFLSIVALTLPALIAALRGSTAHRRGLSRPGSSFIQRYYLDLILAGVAVLLLIELRQRGSVFTPSETGGVSSDPLLLASPALAIVAAGALILRFTPMILRAVARATTTVAGAAFSLGLAQVVRNSGQYTRLTLLLMMAVAVGTFAASYTRTADRSYRDRANYEAGVDLRAAQGPGVFAASKELAELESAVAKLPGISRASSVARTEATFATAGTSQAEFQVLGVDPVAASEMLWFRDDLAGRPMKELLGTISGLPALPGKALPAGSTSISAWVRSDDQLSGITLRAGVRDATGRFVLIPIVELENVTPQWQRFTIDFATLSTAPNQPLTLVALVFTGSASRPTPPTIIVDDIVVTGPDGRDAVLEDFEGAPLWAMFPSATTTQDSYAVVNQGVHEGKGAAKFGLRPGTSSETRGIYLAGFLTPLPVITSQSFVDQTGTPVGGSMVLKLSGGTLVPITIRATFDLFPTTHTRDGALVIFNRDRLLAWSDMAFPGFGSEIERNEVWTSLAPDADIKKLSETLREPPYQLNRITTRQEEIDAATRNPLIAASGSGILLIAFAAVLALVAAALLTSLLAAIRRRRVEFAVIRAIGLSRLQLLAMLALEYSVVFVVGVASGCVLGLFVSSRMLSFLDVTEAGERVEPSFILETRWLMVAAGVLVVFAVFALALWLAARIVSRTSDTQALRTE